MIKRLGFFFLCLPSILCCRSIDTFYGPIDVHEPVLLELIDSPAFQRLKGIHQYGVAYYTTHTEEYNRYDHSIGVFAILRKNKASLEEQIAGLLHDVSHTAFSHVGDWIFGYENQVKDYQNTVHALFLEESGLADILARYDYTVDQILPTEQLFPALENSLPNLCADRIDYNIQGAYYQDFITYDEVELIYEDIHFIDDKRWVSALPELMNKLSRFSLFMTQDCWGSVVNYVTSRWLADAILRAIELGCISYEDLHFGTDQEIWDTLMQHEDPIIKEKMLMLSEIDPYYSIVGVDEADIIVKSKFRGIDPWVIVDSQYFRQTEIDSDLAAEFYRVKQIVTEGWPVKYTR